MTIDLRKLQLEILEAERLIERNKIILQLHIKCEEQAAELATLKAQQESL
jgi:hypothetical protein